MERRKRIPEVLRDVSKHLHYEHGMLMATAFSLVTERHHPEWLRNALIESFVLHFRVLVDFLYGPGKRDDDVLAEHYFPAAQVWRELRPPQSQLLKMSRRRVGKEVAHLTYARLNVTPETKGWDFISIAREVSRVLDLFIKSVPPHLLSDEWKLPIP